MRIRESFADWLKVLLLLLDEAAVLAAVFFILNYLGVNFTLPAAVVLSLLIIPIVLVAHIKVIPTFHRKQVTGLEGMVGMEGKVVQSLKPQGMVMVRGENWRAESAGDFIGSGKKVKVVGVEGLKLRVSQED